MLSVKAQEDPRLNQILMDFDIDPSKAVNQDILDSREANAVLARLAGQEQMFNDFYCNKSAIPGIVPFHGSPCEFKQFSLAKVGTVEGAQGYGHSLYFIDTEDIADLCRQSLTDFLFDYRVNGQSVNGLYNKALQRGNIELSEVLELVRLHNTPKALKKQFIVEDSYDESMREFVAV